MQELFAPRACKCRALGVWVLGMKQPHPLRAWRDEHRLTQAAAAKLVRVHPLTWLKWEKGQHPPITKHLLALTRLTGIETGKLLGV